MEYHSYLKLNLVSNLEQNSLLKALVIQVAILKKYLSLYKPKVLKVLNKPKALNKKMKI